MFVEYDITDGETSVKYVSYIPILMDVFDFNKRGVPNVKWVLLVTGDK